MKWLIAAIATSLLAVPATAVTISSDGVDYSDLYSFDNVDQFVSSTDPFELNYYIAVRFAWDRDNPSAGGDTFVSEYGVIDYYDAERYFLGSGRRVSKGLVRDASGYDGYYLFSLTVDFSTFATPTTKSLSAYVDIDSSINYTIYTDYGDGFLEEDYNDYQGPLAYFSIFYDAPSQPNVAPVPLPAGGMLLLSALGLLGWRYKRN